MDETAEALAKVIARHVSITTLSQAVELLGFCPDWEVRRKRASRFPDMARTTLAGEASAAAAAAGMLPDLAARLAAQMRFDPEAFDALVPYGRRDASWEAKQAALARRAHTMSLPGLSEHAARWMKWICVVAVDLPNGTKRGTGFLVGPDLVLTAWHTVKHRAEGFRRCVIFDHEDGAAIENLSQVGAKTRAVDFHTEWKAASCEDLPGDGVLPDPDPMTADDLHKRQECLDFALLRLQEKIGLQALKPATGGPARGWLVLASPAGAPQQEARPVPVAQDDRIIIPQHPYGHPQRVDFGRYSQIDTELDSSATRLRYNTETAPGTSGAPCFNGNYRLVGMHNASVLKQGVAIANQAIRIDLILNKLKADNRIWNELLAAIPEASAAAQGPEAAELPDAVEPPDVPIWSVSADAAKPLIIIGRRALREWIKVAATDATPTRAARVYAAVGKGAGIAETKGFGKSFSLQVLRAALLGKPDPVVVLGEELALMPFSARDVLGAVAVQLGIGEAEMRGMPPRPSGDPMIGRSGSDKLSFWASKQLPDWFAGVLAGHRRYTWNVSDEARRSKGWLEKMNMPIPPEIVKLSEANEMRVESRWQQVWIVLEHLGEATMPQEVRDLFAGLVGTSSVPEASLHPDLRRLRWMFLGAAPDFLSADATIEVLDPMMVTPEDCLAPIEEMLAALNREMGEETRQAMRRALAALLQNDMLSDPSIRLKVLQNLLADYVSEFRQAASPGGVS
ncbi:trypsin-like serine peptidase [Teichococcus coralli]|nr:serine protease [Pseudoroseomonas coralli]